MKRPVRRHHVVQPTDKPYRFIPLTKFKNAIVDLEDYARINQHNWHAVHSTQKGCYYAMGECDGKYSSMARMILGLEMSDPRIADHRNGDPLDNRKENLRIVTQAQNLLNKRKHRDNRSGYKGVVRAGSRWRAQITFQGQRIMLGYFGCREDTARAYDAGSKKYHGEFGTLNFTSVPSIEEQEIIPEQSSLF